MPKPPLIFQPDDFSCVPTCLLMVLSGFDCNPPMYELRELCKCNEEGTEPRFAISAVKHFGFENSFIAYLESIDELKEELANGHFPIVYLRFSARDNHAVVVVGISPNLVSVLDPQMGERAFDVNEFMETWSGTTIIIEPIT